MSETTRPAEAVAEAIDGLTTLAEGFYGYRLRLEQMGWSPTQAERIAADALAEANRAALSAPWRRL